MAISYITVTLVIVLLLEGLVLTVFFWIFTRSPFLGYLALERADQAAQIYALQAAVHSNGASLNPDITFEPGQPASLRLRGENDPPNLSRLHLDVPYPGPGAAAASRPTFALVIDTNEQVIASSYPDQYPDSTEASQALPDDVELIRAALAGTPDGVLHDTPDGKQAAIARTIWSRDNQPIGMV